MRRLKYTALGLMLLTSQTLAQSDESVLFIGNSFTFGAGSAVRFYRADTVTDLNNLGMGGVPALFKSFTQQAGLNYEVSLETEPGSGLDFHLQNRLGLIARRPWDTVVMHGQSTLDFDKPGDPGKLVETVKQMADILVARNSAIDIHLMATWTRADQIYPENGAWAAQPVAAMANDVRAAYDAAAVAPNVRGVIPVGEAWTRAMETDVADVNPYDGIDFGKVNLWTYDHYHASAHGSYLEALVVFGSLTGLDPRSLGANECSAFELGMTLEQTRALQQVAFDELANHGTVQPMPFEPGVRLSPARCSAID